MSKIKEQNEHLWHLGKHNFTIEIIIQSMILFSYGKLNWIWS